MFYGKTKSSDIEFLKILEQIKDENTKKDLTMEERVKELEKEVSELKQHVEMLTVGNIILMEIITKSEEE